MNYHEFITAVQQPLTKAEMSSNEVTTATPDEVQLWKGYQVLRAIRHKRNAVATKQDLRLLEDKTKIVITSADYRNARRKEILADRANADKYFPLP